MTVHLKASDTKRSKPFITHQYCLVQYIFKDNDHDVRVNPDGNARVSDRPYMKTKASVRNNLENTLKNSKLTPARAISQVNSASGGYMLATSSITLCGNSASCSK